MVEDEKEPLVGACKILHVQPALPPGSLRQRMEAIEALAHAGQWAMSHLDDGERELLAEKVLSRDCTRFTRLEEPCLCPACRLARASSDLHWTRINLAYRQAIEEGREKPYEAKPFTDEERKLLRDLCAEKGRRHVPNAEALNDRAKLLFHRVVARLLPTRPDILGRARLTVAMWQTEANAPSFVQEWAALLQGSDEAVRTRITATDTETKRLRISSPFYLLVPDVTTAWRLRLRIIALRGFPMKK